MIALPRIVPACTTVDSGHDTAALIHSRADRLQHANEARKAKFVALHEALAQGPSPDAQEAT